MANVKLIFGGSDKYDCLEQTIECYVNADGGLYINITYDDLEYDDVRYTVLDKQTAIKLSRELRKQISLMED
jgi:hypothetical protein